MRSDLSALKADWRQEDEGLWAFMAQRDFSVDTRALARPSVSAGFYRRVYFGVDRSRVFVWGASSQSRLGGVGGSVMETPGRNIPAVSAPAELTDKFTPFTQRGRIGSLGSLRNLQTWQLANPKGSEGLKDPPAIVELQASGWGFVSRCASGRLYVWGVWTQHLPTATDCHRCAERVLVYESDGCLELTLPRRSSPHICSASMRYQGHERRPLPCGSAR